MKSVWLMRTLILDNTWKIKVSATQIKLCKNFKLQIPISIKLRRDVLHEAVFLLSRMKDMSTQQDGANYGINADDMNEHGAKIEEAIQVIRPEDLQRAMIWHRLHKK